MGGSRRGMPTLYGIVRYWMDRFERVFPNLRALDIGWGEPFCFRCGWLAPERNTRATTAAVWNAAQGWLDRAHLQDLALGGSNGPENLVPLCLLCHDVMDPCSSRAEAISYVNEGIPASGWWQLYTDMIFGPEGNLYIPHKKKLVRDVYIRWVEHVRTIEAAKHGDPQAVKRVEAIIESVRRREELEGRSFPFTIDDLRASDRDCDRFTTL